MEFFGVLIKLVSKRGLRETTIRRAKSLLVLDAIARKDTIREFVEGNGAKFLVGIQHRDEALARYLERSRIPFVSLDGAAFYVNDKVGGHWNPEGQAFVAERIFKLLAENNIVPR